MQIGEIEANLVHLNDEFTLPYVPELIQCKLDGAEKSPLEDTDVTFYQSEYERLRQMLEDAHEASTLPEAPTNHAALNDLLIRVRLAGK